MGEPPDFCCDWVFVYGMNAYTACCVHTFTCFNFRTAGWILIKSGLDITPQDATAEIFSGEEGGDM
jgi:hypothetical protein